MERIDELTLSMIIDDIRYYTFNKITRTSVYDYEVVLLLPN